jgi:hypothetical protein
MSIGCVLTGPERQNSACRNRKAVRDLEWPDGLAAIVPTCSWSVPSLRTSRDKRVAPPAQLQFQVFAVFNKRTTGRSVQNRLAAEK